MRWNIQVIVLMLRILLSKGDCEISKTLEQRVVALESQQEYLLTRIDQLVKLATTDEDTDVFNRRQFTLLATNYLSDGHEHALAILDFDHYARINEIYGRTTGNLIFNTFAAVARKTLKDVILGKYGGDEFMLLIPDCNENCISDACGKLRSAFADEVKNSLNVGSVTFSMGVTLSQNEPLDDGFKRADEAVYRAKENGRDRCELIKKKYIIHLKVDS